MKSVAHTLSALALLAAGAAGASVTPNSYDMLNGNTGSYTYWDESTAARAASLAAMPRCLAAKAI